MHLILFGYKGCGKSYYGKRLAQQTGIPFIDTDHLIEQLYQKKMGKFLQCREIFKKHGSQLFRSLEIDVVENLNHSTIPSIIAVGGGAILNPENTQVLLRIGKLVYLNLDKKTLKARMLSHPLPSYLDTEHPDESFEKMYTERKPLYEKIPAIELDLRNKTTSEVLEQLQRILYGQ
jgi:shikimate kinase